MEEIVEVRLERTKHSFVYALIFVITILGVSVLLENGKAKLLNLRPQSTTIHYR